MKTLGDKICYVLLICMAIGFAYAMTLDKDFAGMVIGNAVFLGLLTVMGSSKVR